MAQPILGNEPKQHGVCKSNALESQGTDTLPYTFQEETGNNKTGYTTTQYIHFDESPTALESQGMDGGMLQVPTMAQNQTEVTETHHVSSHEIALESQGARAYQYYIIQSCHHDVKDLESQMTHSTSSQDVRALESQGRHYSRARTPPNTMGCTTTSDGFNALESQETSCTSFDDLSALESQGREDTHSNILTALESQGASCTRPAKFDALESQVMNTISSAASEEVLGVSAICESSALKSQEKNDSPSQPAIFETPFTNGPRLYGGTTSTSLSQKSKVTCGSDGEGSSNGQGVFFTYPTLPSSCFVGFLPSTKVITLGSVLHEVEQWKPAFVDPSKMVLVYKRQPTCTPPIIKSFYATMEAEHNYLVRFE